MSMKKNTQKRFMGMLTTGVIFLAAFASLWSTTNTAIAASDEPVNVYFFYGEGCPHCAKEEAFLEREVRDANGAIRVFPFELYYHPENVELVQRVSEKLGVSFGGVPLTIIGSESVFGYVNDATTGGTITRLIEEQREKTEENDPIFELLSEEQRALNFEDIEKQKDAIETLKNGNEEQENDGDEQNTKNNPQTLHLPVFGDINLETVSLPLLTIAVASVDGFNPCAMWALIFLITLLFGMKNRRRMWALGLAFIGVSGAVYFLFLAAWFNVFQFLGFVQWIRILIGFVAIVSGVVHVRNGLKKRELTCETTTTKQKAFLVEKMKAIIRERSFWLAMGGIVIVAASINLVELVCSAGLPAVFTQTLSLAELKTSSYYLYLLLYILFFMLDDIIVFAMAMFTMNVTNISGKYAKTANLIGGVIIAILGLLLVFKPEWIMFG